tara:strand:- start:1547 stop:3103 length:1557 start_codon:yes stop_codon:yes gene_type:complete
MSALSSKNFKKKYAASKNTVSGQGVRPGLPGTGGAIGGGDDYHQKIGRNKRPYYQGEKGTPSQSADAGFSSALSQNVGVYDPEEFEGIMFPDQDEYEEDQDECEEDIYIYDILPLMTRKLASPRQHLKIKEESLELPTMSEIYIHGNIDAYDVINESAAGAVLDAAIAALDLIPGPLLQPVVSILALGRGYFQAKGVRKEGDEANIVMRAITGDTLVEALQMGEEEFNSFISKICAATDQEREELRNELTDVTDTFKDMAQTIAAGMPGRGFTAAILQMTPSGILNFLVELLNKITTTIPGLERVLNNFIGPAYSGLFFGGAMSVVGDPATVLGRMGGPLSKAAMAAMASRYGMILNATHRDPKPCTTYLSVVPGGETEQMEPMTTDLEAAVSSAKETYADLISKELRFKEGISDNLRQLIREAVYEMPAKLRNTEPQEFLDYDPLRLGEEGEEENRDDESDESYENPNEYAVAYKTDDGIATYYPRAMSESDLREFVRGILDEAKRSKKKIKKTMKR